MEENNNILGTTIRNARIAMGFSIQDLSNKSGISTSHIYKIETVKTIPHLFTLRALCDALGINYVEFLEKLDYSISNGESNLGNTIRNARIAKGLSQHDLSELSGVTQAQISHIESGESIPQSATLKKLCAPLSLDFEELSKLSTNPY